MVHMRDYTVRLFVLCSASILSVINTVSLPTFPTIDVARASFNGTLEGVNDLRMGPWSFCLFLADRNATPCDVISPCNALAIDNLRVCNLRQYGYDVEILLPGHGVELINVGRSWTRGLATHAAATAITSLALASLILRKVIHYLGLVAFLVTLIAFVSDIAFFFHLRALLSTVEVAGVTAIANTGPGLWVSLVIFCLVVAESSASEGDLRLQRLKEGFFSKNLGNLISNEEVVKDAHVEKNTATKVQSDLTYECPLCWDSKAELYAVPCHDTHIFCKSCIEKHLKQSARCPRCISSLPIYREELRRVKVVP